MSAPQTAQVSSITVHADARYARTVRMCAMSIATLAELGIDDCDDVRMAAEEAFVIACGSGLDSVTMTFELDVDSLKVSCSLKPGMDADDQAIEYALLVLQAVSDECVFDAAGGSLSVVKMCR